MRALTQLHFKRIVAIWAVLMLPFFTACNTDYTGKHFSFPPGSKPYENNWKYTGQVIVSSNQNPITKKSKKNIQIKIYDKNKIIFLKDDFQVISASIDTNVVWEKFEEIQIELLEVGNEYAKDSYNQQLLKGGPRRLFSLSYHYDQGSRKFKRVY